MILPITIDYDYVSSVLDVAGTLRDQCDNDGRTPQSIVVASAKHAAVKRATLFVLFDRYTVASLDEPMYHSRTSLIYLAEDLETGFPAGACLLYLTLYMITSIMLRMYVCYSHSLFFPPAGCLFTSFHVRTQSSNCTLLVRTSTTRSGFAIASASVQ